MGIKWKPTRNHGYFQTTVIACGEMHVSIILQRQNISFTLTDSAIVAGGDKERG